MIRRYVRAGHRLSLTVVASPLLLRAQAYQADGGEPYWTCFSRRNALPGQPAERLAAGGILSPFL